MSRFLTAAEVAAAAGISTRNVARWAGRRGIRPVRDGRRYLYPAAPVTAAAVAVEQHRLVAAALRQLHFIRNPLNWTVEDRP